MKIAARNLLPNGWSNYFYIFWPVYSVLLTGCVGASLLFEQSAIYTFYYIYVCIFIFHACWPLRKNPEGANHFHFGRSLRSMPFRLASSCCCNCCPLLLRPIKHTRTHKQLGTDIHRSEFAKRKNGRKKLNKRMLPRCAAHLKFSNYGPQTSIISGETASSVAKPANSLCAAVSVALQRIELCLYLNCWATVPVRSAARPLASSPHRCLFLRRIL